MPKIEEYGILGPRGTHPQFLVKKYRVLPQGSTPYLEKKEVPLDLFSQKKEVPRPNFPPPAAVEIFFRKIFGLDGKTGENF